MSSKQLSPQVTQTLVFSVVDFWCRTTLLEKVVRFPRDLLGLISTFTIPKYAKFDYTCNKCVEIIHTDKGTKIIVKNSTWRNKPFISSVESLNGIVSHKFPSLTVVPTSNSKYELRIGIQTKNGSIFDNNNCCICCIERDKRIQLVKSFKQNNIVIVYNIKSHSIQTINYLQNRIQTLERNIKGLQNEKKGNSKYKIELNYLEINNCYSFNLFRENKLIHTFNIDKKYNDMIWYPIIHTDIQQILLTND